MTVLYSNNFDAETVGTLPTGWANKTGTWQVAALNPVSGANALRSVAGTDGDAVMYTAAAYADMAVSTKQKLIAGTGGKLPSIGHIVRCDSGYLNGYVAILGLTSGTGCTAYIFKRSAGGFALLTSAALSWTAVAGDTIYLKTSIQGSVINLYAGINALPGTVSLTTSDGSFTAAGYSGFYYAADSSGVTTLTIDDFSLSDFAAGATAPNPPTIGTATAGNTQATVSFTAPASNGGSAITGYTATSSPGGFTGTLAGATASPITVTGLTNGTAYTFTVTATNAIGTSTVSAASNSVTPISVNNVLISNTANILFSPYNWDVGTSTAKTINAGAYFKILFTGTSCTLQFDVAAALAPYSQIMYQVDGGAVVVAPIAASVVISMPSATSGWSASGGHLLEVFVKSTSETISRWTASATMVSLTGINLDAAATISAPPALPLKAIYFGDSITEGVRTVNMTATNDTDRNDALLGWAYRSAKILGAECGIVGFGRQGLLTTGNGGVPVFGSTYALQYAGVARSFAVQPDYIVINQGTNDAGDVTATMQSVLNSLLAATSTTKIIVLRPFNATTHALEIQNAIAGCSAPARCTYINTSGYFNTANSSDALHPYGNENITHIAPLIANAISSVITISKGTTTLRTVTLTLVDSSNVIKPSLSGLKWAFFDKPQPNLFILPIDSGSSGSTNASGVMTLSVNTTLASGATGWLIVSDSDGTTTQSPASKAFSAPVVIA